MRENEDRKIFLGNISFSACESDIKELCSVYGEIETIIMLEHDIHPHRGYCFVKFITKEQAEEAIKKLNEKEFMGRILSCQYAYKRRY